MSEVKVTELDDLCKRWKEKEDEIAVLAEQVKQINKEISGIKASIAGHLAEANRTDYVSPFGKVKTVERWQTKMPGDLERKNELWGWMREKGIYDAYATVHATALNSLFLKERELAVERGEDLLTFALPGMEPATLFEDVKITKK